SMALCRWEREDFRNQPTWVVGGFICVVSWDFSFSANTLCLVEPQAVRQLIRDVLEIGRLKASYLDIRKNRVLAEFLYIQEPFAMRELLSAYTEESAAYTTPKATEASPSPLAP
ncbi:MAG: hypothetical protein NT167_28590, partial [Verrucomicrobia bacterium]|nr:hypothetical protein [Verrucomicrobiota bacterium]